MKAQPLTESLYYILLSVTKPNYGYGIMEEIKKMSNNITDLGKQVLREEIVRLEELIKNGKEKIEC